MQSSRTPQRKAPKFLDTKVLIAALAMAVTIGFWNIFSSGAVQAEKAAAPTPVATVPPPTTSDTAQGLPPIPTLVPLITVSSAAPQQGGNLSVNKVQPNIQALPLRSVSAPSLVIVQKGKPMVDAASSAGGGGGGGGGGAAKTRSSK
jgi:hypothetical protein